ncbi:Enoyl-CoA hydratase/carnithine racemase [Salinihabitans flavidus]|uniref:Enoyl-CoA hydratase/carnithine racemase n=1 Tax=Salinihabitans flavidus TaxID=569882 RepID=A0A1H8UQ14_9RHOB|nr:enoyl-CoA hydratase-related protein [Salinihabitans flavidus]SEP05004.1 Enoyl-CoA hydratase/carnithine racemase [Salinihabitans flavidus]
MSGNDVLYDREGAAAVLTLCRPEKLNAARPETHEALIAGLDRAEADEAVRCVIITGAGRAFCAGTDISDGFGLPHGGNPETGEGVPPDIGGVTVLRLFRMNKPLIAAVNGIAAGFGASLSIACDFRLASDSAKWAFIFARRGIAAESCSSWFLPRVVGVETALDWMLTGRTVSAKEARDEGLVRKLLSEAELLPAALAIAEEIAANTAPVSVAMNRRLVWEMMGAAHPAEAHALESRAIAARLSHRDSAEGVAAFSEKRRPNFDQRLDAASVMRGWWPEETG